MRDIHASDLHDFAMFWHAETVKAILVSDNGEEAEAIWLPKSQIEFERQPDGSVEVAIPEWLAKEKGLI